MREQLIPFKEKMDKTIAVLAEDYASIRAGRANPGILDRLSVEYYGAMTPVNQVAAVSVAEARILVIQPWDRGALKAIEKAINTSEIGIPPQNDGSCIRLVFPPLTEERRKELGKQISKHAEEAKINIRNIRRDGLEKIKAMKKASEITEDDVKIAEDKMKKITEEFTKKVDAVAAEKEEELMVI